VAIIAAAWWIMPQAPRRIGTKLDIPGALVLFVGLLCLIGPLLFGRDVGWAPWVWLAMAAGAAVIAGFVWLERKVEASGGMPLIDLHLLADHAFMRGLCAVFAFFFANLSFYLVMTLFMQNALHMAPLQAGLVFVPPALTFVVAARFNAARTRHRGIRALIEGCMVQLVGLAGLAITVIATTAPSTILLVLPLIVFGFGQGMVFAPLSGVVLSTVPAASAGSGSGIYGTINQIGNAAGVAAIGAVYFTVQSAAPPQFALLASFAVCALSLMACATFLAWMRRAGQA
jgi:predicted MFS family arabinose efflux permease